MQSFIDNVTVTLNDELKSTLRTRGRLSIAAASFSIYAYEALKKELENIEELHFLFTKPTFTKTDAVKNGKEQREFYIPKLNRERSLYGTEFEIKLRNQLSQKAIAKLLERHSEKVPRKFLESSLKVPRNCPEKAQKTYIAIAQNPQVTSKKLSEELKISDRAVRKHIKELKAAGLIERIGSDRAGHWRIIAAEND